MNRRLFLKTLLASPLITFSSFSKEQVFRKKIPSSNEPISSIGMGTWLTFDIGYNTKDLTQRRLILEAFFKHGGQIIDSSPMYGSSEKTLGKALNMLENKDHLFSATKIWTPSKWHGIKQIDNSKRLWGVKKFDLLQVHNLVNYEEHLETLFEMKKNGLLRYVGVTTSHGSRHHLLSKIMKKYDLDFIQLTYNIIDLEAEKYLLPLANEKKIAVIANRPFQGGKLLKYVKNKNLTNTAIGLGIKSWPEYFLKFIISSPQITCTIPATSSKDHMIENMTGLYGNIPDKSDRYKLLKEFMQV